MEVPRRRGLRLLQPLAYRSKRGRQIHISRRGEEIMHHTQILQGDSFQLLEGFKDDFFDYCLTSPYFKDEDVKKECNMEYWPWFDKLIELLSRKVRKVAFIFQSSTKIIEMIMRYNQWVRRILVWGKDPSRYAYRYEPIFVFLFDKDFKVNKYLFKDFWRLPSILGNSKSYANPPKLYKEIIMLLPPGRIIDPFAGTGTLGLACRGLNHEVYLIDKKLIKIAKPLLNYVVKER